MPFTLTMPKLSPTMEAGTLVKWHKKVGDHVEAGDLLFEVATDKATVEHNALDEGYLRKIIVTEGQDATVNQAVAIFTEDKNESIEGYKPTGLEIKTETLAEPTSSDQPTLTKKVPQATTYQQPAFVPEPPLTNYSYTHPTEPLTDRILASPLARKLAKDKNLDLSTIKGTGPNNRIMERDLDLAQPSGPVAFGHRDTPKEIPGSYEEEQLTPIRKVIAQRLQESKSFIPHFYVTQEVKANALVDMRDQLRTWGVKVTFNDFVVRACALALRKHPVVNSAFNTVNQTVAHFKTIDICIAVNIPSGLITPIVRHADFKNLGELSTEIRSLAARAKEGKLTPTEYKGGSFTISNMGMLGVTSFQAIINPPQAAILAVGGISDRPIIHHNQIIPGKILTLSLSVDHRVVDGVIAAEFIKTVQHYLENPAGLLL